MPSEEFLRCPVCKHPYKSPKLLDCLHSICKECLHTSLKSNQSETGLSMKHRASGNVAFYTCRVCDSQTKCTVNSQSGERKFILNKLPDNMFISSVLDAINVSKNKPTYCSRCTKSQVETSTPSQPSRVDAITWCYECSEALCDGCTNKHNSVENRKHDITNITDVLEGSLRRRKSRDMFCVEHPDDKLKYFCVNCRSLACMQCTVISHKKHYCVSVKEALKLYKPEIDGIRKRIKSYHNDVHELKSAIPAYLNKTGAKAERDIHEYFDKLVDLLRKKQNELLEELTLIREVEESKANQAAEIHDKYCRVAKNMNTFLCYLLKHGSDTEILHYYETMRKHEVCQHLAKQDSEKLARYTFYKGQMLDSLVESLGQNLSLDVSYFHGDFVPKALRLFRNSTERVPMKCIDGNKTDPSNPTAGRITNLRNSRSVSVSDLSKLNTSSESTNPSTTPNTKMKIVEFTDDFKPVVTSTASMQPLTGQTKSKSPRQTPYKLFKEKLGSRLRSTGDFSQSVPDISMLTNPSRASYTVDSKGKENRGGITCNSPPKPAGPSQVTNAFERLRRLANMDGKTNERRSSLDKSRFRSVRHARLGNAGFVSMENLSHTFSSSPSPEPDTPRLSMGRGTCLSPTVMAVNELSPDETHPSMEDEFTFDDEDFILNFNYEKTPKPWSRSNSESGPLTVDSSNESLDTQTTMPEADSVFMSPTYVEKPDDLEDVLVSVTSVPQHVFSCRIAGDTDSGRNSPESVTDDERCPAGIVCLPDGNLVIADAADNCVKLFTTAGKILDSFCLQGDEPEPRDVTLTRFGQVAVLYHERHLIAFLATQDKLCLETTVSTSKGYVAIASYAKDYLAVTCVFPSAVDVINMDGDVIRAISIFDVVPSDDAPLFYNPWYIACTPFNEIVISEHSKKFVLCTTSRDSRKYLYQAADNSLLSPRGVCADHHGNVLIVDESMNNVRMLSPTGRCTGIIMNKVDHGIDVPINVTFGNANDVIIVQRDGLVKIFKGDYKTIEDKVP